MSQHKRCVGIGSAAPHGGSRRLGEVMPLVPALQHDPLSRLLTLEPYLSCGDVREFDNPISFAETSGNYYQHGMISRWQLWREKSSGELAWCRKSAATFVERENPQRQPPKSA